MNVATIKRNDIANGPGIRVSLFVSGCRHRCPGCFNREAWDFSFGEPYTADTEALILTALEPDYVEGLTLLGGEPFEPENQEELLSLCRIVREKYPHKTVWCYTGFLLEDLLAGKVGDPAVCRALLQELDVLVDGRFEADKKSLALRFRGSSNQRILDMPASLDGQRAVWLTGKWERKMGKEDMDF